MGVPTEPWDGCITSPRKCPHPRLDEGRQLLNCFGLSKEERYSWKIGFDERMNNNFLFDFVKKDLDRSVIQKIEINNDIFN